MSHRPPPPSSPQSAPHPNNFNNYYGFNLDIGSLPDLTGGQVNPPSPAMRTPGLRPYTMGADGQGNDIMAMLDNNMLGSMGDVSMGLESVDDSNMNGSFGNAQSSTEESVARAENQFNTAANNVPGAGPLPAGAFAQMNLAGASTLTEFTKRRNWPAKVVEELRDFLQILDANGRIKYASPSILQVTGYSVEEIQDVFLKDLIHPDDQGVFVAELNESIASGNPLRLFYRFKKKDEKYAIFETVGHAHIAGAKFAPNPNNQSPFCQAVFMMARPYPTKNAGLLDSFLEHKIENERLKRIAIPMERDPRTGDKKKKLKTSEEYVCTDCGTLDSPEWRKGPQGPKTLCNACGLRWAKREKKRTSTSHPPTVDPSVT
ncbi:Cutinase palindrome-binding protein [Fusarium acuminatum]|uniref:Cutinase palindrome-binding protein n=1 Tax=Fusarium acuminatum TaxID=5515 RepID=A0ABZ2WJ66_9HYPO